MARQQFARRMAIVIRRLGVSYNEPHCARRGVRSDFNRSWAFFCDPGRHVEDDVVRHRSDISSSAAACECAPYAESSDQLTRYSACSPTRLWALMSSVQNLGSSFLDIDYAITHAWEISGSSSGSPLGSPASAATTPTSLPRWASLCCETLRTDRHIVSLVMQIPVPVHSSGLPLASWYG
jgi:hypothetical protein